MRLLTLFGRGLRLRCPVCGQGPLFKGWFRMHDRCSQCGFNFQRGPGYWLGSIYFNYGLTALIVTAAYFGLYFGARLSPNVLLWSLGAFCFLFPLWFFRYARSLWIGFDLYWDPDQAKDIQQTRPATERK